MNKDLMMEDLMKSNFKKANTNKFEFVEIEV